MDLLQEETVFDLGAASAGLAPPQPSEWIGRELSNARLGTCGWLHVCGLYASLEQR